MNKLSDNWKKTYADKSTDGFLILILPYKFSRKV